MSRSPYIRQTQKRRPFWLPASSYYVMAAAVSIAFFFLVWGILHDEGEETPWVTAGVGASLILAGAVVLREIILRHARERFVQMERRVKQNVSEARAQIGDLPTGEKLTLERNSAILKHIRQKSDAAKVLSKFSAGHREVFELCTEYLARNESELTTVSAGSPRLAALLRGRNVATQMHRFHTLQWAEIEARALTTEANTAAAASEKLRAAQEAMQVVDLALQSYPTEERLLESRTVLRELSVSIKVSDLVEQAERAAFKNDYRSAIGIYRDALFYLGRDNVHTVERQAAAGRITAEMDRLRLLDGRE
jgi:hypothetical protein